MVELSFFHMALFIGGPIATFSVLIVWLIMAFIWPARNSPAWTLIRAKKKRQPVVFLDKGAFWTVSVGKNEGPGFIEDEDGSMISVVPNSMKMCMGVRMAVGEFNRSITASPTIMRMIELAKEQNIKAKEIKEAVEKLTIEGDDNVREEEKTDGIPEEERREGETTESGLQDS